MTTDKVKEIVNYAFGVYYSEHMGQGDYTEDEAEEALDTALNALDEVEKYKKAIEEFKTRIDYECGSKGLDDYDYCSGLIYAKRILEVRLKGGERMTYNDLWIPVNRRRMTADEEKAIREQYEIDSEDEENLFVFENIMPKNGERVLVTYEYTLGGVTKRSVYVDYCGYDKVCYTLKNCGTWEKITAWMPYPQAYTVGTHKTPANVIESEKGIKISPEEHNALYKASDALIAISERMTEQGIKEIKFSHKDEIPNKYSAGMLNGIARALYEIDKAKEV